MSDPIRIGGFDDDEVETEDGPPVVNDPVNHPHHYGGRNNPHEAIKVIEAWGLNFNLGNVVKYIARAGKKSKLLQDLLKAQWSLNREIENLRKEGYEE